MFLVFHKKEYYRKEFIGNDVNEKNKKENQSILKWFTGIL